MTVLVSLLQDSRPCCTIAYTENDLIVILVLFLSTLWRQQNKALGHTESLPQSLAVAALQNFLTECCVHFLPPHFLNFGGGLHVWVCFLLKVLLRQSPPSETFLMWKRCQQTARAEHLLPAVGKHVWKCSWWGQDRAVCAFCCWGSCSCQKPSQEPWLLVLTCNPKLFLRAAPFCVWMKGNRYTAKGAVILAIPSKKWKCRYHQNLSALMVCGSLRSPNVQGRQVWSKALVSVWKWEVCFHLDCFSGRAGYCLWTTTMLFFSGCVPRVL